MSDNFGINSSLKPVSKKMKIMTWGATGTRKTEGVLRHLPNVLVIDTEGNVEQCVGMPEIPEFMYVVTKDSRKVMDILDAVAAGKIKMPNGEPVLTFCIDSWTVLWAVQQEVAAKSAEKRNAKKGWSIEDATMTQIDWVMAKRPLKRIQNRFSASPLKFLVLTCREKDNYENDPQHPETPKKVGFTYDCIKGTDFDMNLAMRFFYEDLGMGKKGPWTCEVTKVQGALGKDFSMGKRFKEFPIDLIAKHAGAMEQTVASKLESEEDVASALLSHEEHQSEPRTQKEMIKFAAQFGIDAKTLGTILTEGGFSPFDPGRWTEMKGYIQQVAQVPQAQ